MTPGDHEKIVCLLIVSIFGINHTPNKPCNKKIEAHVFSVTNTTAVPKNLKTAPTTLLKIAGNASAAFPARLLRASASLLSHCFKVSSSFAGEAEPLPPPTPPKMPVIASTIVEIVKERAVTTCNCNTLLANYGTNSFCPGYIFIKELFIDLLDPCDLRLKIFFML